MFRLSKFMTSLSSSKFSKQNTRIRKLRRFVCCLHCIVPHKQTGWVVCGKSSWLCFLPPQGYIEISSSWLMAKIYQHMTQMYRNREAADSLLMKCYHLSPRREVLGTVEHKQATLTSNSWERERDKLNIAIKRLTFVTTGRKRVKADTENTICI